MTDLLPTKRYIAIVPAAGVGRRVGGLLPKQYLQIAGKTVLEHTLTTLLSIDCLEQIIVPVSRDDRYWQSITLMDDPRITRVPGGAERVHSVQQGLLACTGDLTIDDWVLVHDVARPCIQKRSVLQLIEQVKDHPVGGILAVPVVDTIKRVSESRIKETVDRRQLWQAQTPQMFRFGLLKEAIDQGLSAGYAITDEASALEYAGLTPQIVEGLSSNLKITRPEDLALASYYLQQADL